MIWLIGANGMLGKEFTETLERWDLEYCSSDLDVDITDCSALEKFAAGKDINWIINASAYTAVDKAEAEEGLALAINGEGVGHVGVVASGIGAKVIHFSTDYVFDGEKTGFYFEEDSPCPVSAYGRTKLAGEVALQKATEQHFILRISWLYGQYGPNFVSTMLQLFNERDQLGIVADQYGAPTWSRVLTENVVAHLLMTDCHTYGIYHYSDAGCISWYDFASAIYDEARSMGILTSDVEIKQLETEEYPTSARRPKNSGLDKSKIEELGFEVHPWRANLKKYLQQVRGQGYEK